MDPSTTSIEPVLDALRTLWVARYVYTANLSVLMYEYAITLDDEKRYIWPLELSLSKTIFLFNRYFPFASTLVVFLTTLVIDPSATNLCIHLEEAACMMVALQFISAQASLFMRAYAVWERNVIVAVFTTVALATLSGMGLYYSLRFARSVTIANIPLHTSGCQVGGTGRLIPSLILLLVTEMISITLLLSKTIWCCFFIPSEVYQLRGASATHHSVPSLLTTLVQDGITYFLLILVLVVANMLVNILVTGPVRPVFVTIQATVQNILCSRLMIHVRNRHRLATHGRSTMTVSSMAFASYAGSERVRRVFRTIGGGEYKV